MNACTPERHRFGDDDSGITLTEGESKSCHCEAVAVALRNGQVETTVRATLLNEQIAVSIGNLSGGDGR